MRLKDTYKNRFKDKFRNDYFISFRNKNKGCKIAANIHKELEKEKYTNYYNPQQHNQEKAGYPKRLHRNVKHCKVFIWILTEDCMMAREDKPDYYFAEIIWAHKYNRCIVPVMSEKFKNNRIDNDLLKKQFYKAYDNLLKCNVLTPKDKKVVDNIVSRYCTDTSIWGGHDIPEEKPLSKKIVAEIIDRVRKTRWVNPVKNRWIKIPIIHTSTFVAVVLVISSVWGGFSLDWYKTLFQRQDVIKAVWTTVRVTGISTLVSVSLATLGAIGFYKYDFKGKSLLDSMLYLPAVVPPLVLGIALFSLYNILHIQLGEPTIIIAHITFCTPFAFSTIKGTLDGFDHSIEEAARDLGCGQMQAILKVIVPNIMPGVLSAALMCVTISMDDVLTSYFVSGSGHNTLSMLIYSLVKKGVKPDINALSTIMIVLSVLLGLISQIAGSRSKGRSEE